MKTLTALLVAAAAISIPAAARPSRDLGPLGNVTETAQTVSIVLTRLDLGRSQRDKVFELIGRARNNARDIERNRRLNVYQRQERLTDASTELRGRIIHVLNGDQKARLRELLGGDRNDGPRYRPSDDKRNNDRNNRRRGDSRSNRSQDNWPWQ